MNLSTDKRYNSFVSVCVPIRNIADYSPFGVQLDGRTQQGDFYRFGYQGSEKDDESKGSGNSYTTFYRQLDPRVGKWLSIDSKASSMPWQSPYCSMDNNPIWFNDVFGDSIKTDQKGFEAVKGGLDATLQKSNPFTYNKEKGVIEFDKNVDISKLDDKQKEIVDNFKSVVEDEEFIVNVQVVENDKEFKGTEGKQTTLRKELATGVIVLRDENYADVFLSKDPLVRRDGELKPALQKEDEQGITVLHEIGGHAYFYSQNVYNKYENNSKTEQFERVARDSYKGKYLKDYIKKQTVKGH
jgi:RHS repeat-associated protein